MNLPDLEEVLFQLSKLAGMMLLSFVPAFPNTPGEIMVFHQKLNGNMHVEQVLILHSASEKQLTQIYVITMALPIVTMRWVTTAVKQAR